MCLVFHNVREQNESQLSALEKRELKLPTWCPEAVQEPFALSVTDSTFTACAALLTRCVDSKFELFPGDVYTAQHGANPALPSPVLSFIASVTLGLLADHNEELLDVTPPSKLPVISSLVPLRQVLLKLALDSSGVPAEVKKLVRNRVACVHCS